MTNCGSTSSSLSYGTIFQINVQTLYPNPQLPRVILHDSAEMENNFLLIYQPLSNYFHDLSQSKSKQFYLSFHSLQNKLPNLPNQGKSGDDGSGFSPIYLKFSAPSHQQMFNLFTQIINLSRPPKSLNPSSTLPQDSTPPKPPNIINQEDRLTLLEYARFFASPTPRSYAAFLDFQPEVISYFFSGSILTSTGYTDATPKPSPLSRSTVQIQSGFNSFYNPNVNIQTAFHHYYSSTVTNLFRHFDIEQHAPRALERFIKSSNSFITPQQAAKYQCIEDNFVDEISNTKCVTLPAFNRGTKTHHLYNQTHSRFSVKIFYALTTQSTAANDIQVDANNFKTVSKALAAKIRDIWDNSKLDQDTDDVHMFRMPLNFESFDFLFVHVHNETSKCSKKAKELHLNFSQVSISHPNLKSNEPILGYRVKACELVDLIKSYIEEPQTQESTQLSTPESTPESTQSPTPESTPESTQSPTPESTQSPTPELTPESTKPKKPTKTKKQSTQSTQLPKGEQKTILFEKNGTPSTCYYGVIYHQPYVVSGQEHQIVENSQYIHIPFCRWSCLTGLNFEESTIDEFIKQYDTSLDSQIGTANH